MRILLTILTTVLLTSPWSGALDRKEILALMKKPHSREGISPELAVYANGRTYKYDSTVFPAEGDPIIQDTSKGTIKVVEGKYIIFTFERPDGGGEGISVVTYDKKAGLYRKYFLEPDGAVSEIIGLSSKGSRAISWFNLQAGLPSIAMEQNTDKGATWTRVFLQGRTPLAHVQGEAHTK